MPLTAHFIGGCTIGDSPETGVVDPYQRVYGYPGLHVADGSAISANLGVNPSLTITAQAERAMSLWPNKGEADPGPRWGRTTSGSPRSHPCTRSCPRRPPVRCGCRSSGSAEFFSGHVTRGPRSRWHGCETRWFRSLPVIGSLVPGAVQQWLGTPRARPSSLPGRALVPFLGPGREGRSCSIDSASDREPRPRPRPRRRLRRPVRPADRPPGARGAGLLRDRAAHDAGRRDAGPQAEGDHPLRRPVVGLRRGCARHRPGDLHARGPGLRHVLRLPADGPGPRRRGRPHRRA